ncbi:putative sulfate exporter family transporter [Sneathiella sp. P13V-1]|uniref:YeiH family protein n=1 Tax=Sneathiella sp. P13V-1 TaxID=2697366 RepID=UPI00187B6DA6|nr:putative sulfate exporter family transporter [Sneathiella sp. P13V-1]MBE7637803.1 putative sulfate exporter family transporter [Sneathiella sp. P13V-1]
MLKRQAEQMARETKTIFPGLLVCLTIAMASGFLSDHYGGPVMLFALLLGMAFHFLSEEGACKAGIEFAARTILRIGVALLGVRITFDQIADLGGLTIAGVAAGLVLTILFGWILAQVLKLKPSLGLLSGGAVAICGASAALALSAVMPKTPYTERNTIVTVVAVTTLSTVAMVVYPLITEYFAMDHVEAGVFLGGTIHDVAQVVGAGYSVSEEAGDVSTVVKLLRVTLLVPVVLVFSFIFSASRKKKGEESSLGILPPAFLIGFVIFVFLNSMSYLPSMAIEHMTDLSRMCLVTAIAGLGMKTSLKEITKVGWPVVILVVSETIFIALFIFLLVACF